MSNRDVRNFPRHTLGETLAIPQKIQDEVVGKPFKRLLLADTLDLKPGSSNFQSVGYNEPDENSIEIKTTHLLKKLIGFGLVKITKT
jgi:hypothetical protein